jgi:hypothetical protein
MINLMELTREELITALVNIGSKHPELREEVESELSSVVSRQTEDAVYVVHGTFNSGDMSILEQEEKHEDVWQRPAHSKWLAATRELCSTYEIYPENVVISVSKAMRLLKDVPVSDNETLVRDIMSFLLIDSRSKVEKFEYIISEANKE